MIIDTHLHLNNLVNDSAELAVNELLKQMNKSKVLRAIVIHLEDQGWSKEEFSEAISKSKKLHGFVNINPYSGNANKELRNSIEKLNFIGLKIHPRIQKIDLDDKRTDNLVRFAGEMNIPVIIDAFPDGISLMEGFSVRKYALLAKKNPNTRFIWAHCGGHYVIDFMLAAKRFKNVFMDISYSLLYFMESNISKDIIYAMKSMKFDKIMYGSDYPDRTIKETITLSKKIMKKEKLNTKEMNKIFFLNAKNFFRWNDI